jgi:hypothetical protein
MTTNQYLVEPWFAGRSGPSVGGGGGGMQEPLILVHEEGHAVHWLLYDTTEPPRRDGTDQWAPKKSNHQTFSNCSMDESGEGATSTDFGLLYLV